MARVRTPFFIEQEAINKATSLLENSHHLSMHQIEYNIDILMKEMQKTIAYEMLQGIENKEAVKVATHRINDARLCAIQKLLKEKFQAAGLVTSSFLNTIKNPYEASTDDQVRAIVDLACLEWISQQHLDDEGLQLAQTYLSKTQNSHAFTVNHGKTAGIKTQHIHIYGKIVEEMINGILHGINGPEIRDAITHPNDGRHIHAGDIPVMQEIHHLGKKQALAMGYELPESKCTLM